MAELRQLTRPVVRSAAGFHADQAGRELSKEGQDLGPTLASGGETTIGPAMIELQERAIQVDVAIVAKGLGTEQSIVQDAQVARGAFPRGSSLLSLRDELGPISATGASPPCSPSSVR